MSVSTNVSLPEVSLGDERIFSCIDYLEKRTDHMYILIQLDNQVLKEDGVPRWGTYSRH